MIKKLINFALLKNVHYNFKDSYQTDIGIQIEGAGGIFKERLDLLKKKKINEEGKKSTKKDKLKVQYYLLKLNQNIPIITINVNETHFPVKTQIFLFVI